MPANTPLSGWNSTDDGQEVPVRAASAPQNVIIGAAPEAHRAEPAPAIPATMNTGSMKLAAFFGVAIVLLGAALYFGVGNLRGDVLTPSPKTATGTVITITAAGTFDPATVTVQPGQTFTIQNANKDPQVLKSTNTRELFPVQVIFTDPFSFTVPADAMGPYVYFSETLPENYTLTINVLTEALSSSAASTASANTSIPSTEIPLPFAAPSAATPSASNTAPTVVTPQVSTQYSRIQPAVISLGGAMSSSVASFTPSASLPMNPYTVAQGKSNASSELAKAQSEKLHSGAPLREIRKPKSNTSTGPTGAILLMLPAILCAFLVYRKTVRM